MYEFRRNLIVGIFVLIALIALGVMIILFGETPEYFQTRTSYRVGMYFDTAGPIQNGDPVLINGLQVGRVKWIEPREDIRKGVVIVTEIQNRYKIPIDAQPTINEQAIGFAKTAVRIDISEKNSAKSLPTDGTGVIQGTVSGGIQSLIPPDVMKKLDTTMESITVLAQSLKPVADDLHVLFKPTALPTTQTSQSATVPASQPLANISTAVQRLDTALAGLNQIVANPNNQKNFELMLKNFREVGEQGTALAQELRKISDRTDQRIEAIARGLRENTDKLSLLLDRLTDAANLIAKGRGSAGKLLNDPELYDALSISAQRLGLAIQDLHELLQQWREKGLKIQGGILGK